MVCGDCSESLFEHGDMILPSFVLEITREEGQRGSRALCSSQFMYDLWPQLLVVVFRAGERLETSLKEGLEMEPDRALRTDSAYSSTSLTTLERDLLSMAACTCGRVVFFILFCLFLLIRQAN